MATDGTQYLIELAAKFNGGDSAVTTLAELGDRMLKAGATSQDLERAAKATAVSIEEAASAVKLANAALGDGEGKYAAAEVAADKAAKAVERIAEKAQGLTGKLQTALDVGDDKKVAKLESAIWAMAVKEQEAAVQANALTGALKAEAAAMDLLKGKATAATASHDDLKKGLGNVKSAAEQAKKAEVAAAGTGKVNEMAEALGKLGGPAGVAGQKVLGVASGFSKLKTAMGAGGPYVAVAVAIVAIASAAALAAVGIAQWGVSLADTNRTQGLLMDGIARSSAGGAELADAIDRIGNVVPSTRAELMGMAKGLADSGLRGKELSAALETAAVKAATLKFGPDFAAEMLSLDFQAKKFGDNIASTFGGLKIDPLLKGISTLGALFDSGTSSGKAMKFLFESLFQPLIDGAVAAIPKIERLFLYAEILALKAYIALKPYGFVFEFIGKAMLVVAGIVVGTLAVALGIVAAAIAVQLALWTALAFAIYGLYQAVVEFIPKAGAAIGDFVFSMVQMGGDLIDGLVNGITGKASAVVDAISGTVTRGIEAAKKLLGIASPSKVFAAMGDNTAQGFASGVDDGAGDAQGALESMVAPPKAGAAGGRAGGGAASIIIENMIVQGENAKELASDFIEQITKLLEGDALTLGGGETAHA